MDEPTDIGLIAACQQGDATALRQVFERYQDQVYRLCRHMAGNAQDAEDLTQECFVQAFGHLHSFRGDSAFGTWLFRIAANCCLGARRKRHAAFVPLDPDLPQPGGSGPEDQLLRRELAGRVEAAIAALPANQRLLFVLGTQLEMPYQQIGLIAGCSEDAVKMRLHRARKQVREALKTYLET
ncbi:MAG: sigma-70 family RNA polymerase sigma factor [Candidatus Latescibacteria bacterium]|nr:sigma-70 family RNA polymerase sigma factor [Candidatus Latescibacterota bacterium]